MNEDMDAPVLQSSCSEPSPKLREGERVEVRQRDKGLRGSWHPATIVGLKPGRCIVQYDELLAEDGTDKLTESIPLVKCAQKSSSPCPVSSPFVSTPASSSMPTTSRKRGFLRPVPPAPTDPSPFTWKGGLFIDVLYQDAWWEAVLLDDIVKPEENSLVNVIYPDEGDLACVPIKDLRISQLWDEVTGEWFMKGSCNLSRFLKRRGITRKEIMQTTSINQDELHQISSAQSKLKLFNGACSFSAMGLPGGNAAGGALLQDMTYYVQARAALFGGNCKRDFDGSGSDQILILDQTDNEDCLYPQPSQSPHPETAKIDSASCRLQPDDAVEDTRDLHKRISEGFRSSKCSSDDLPCRNGTELKDCVKVVDASNNTQHLTKQSSEEEARPLETGRWMCLSQFDHQTCISQEPPLSSLSETGRVDSTSSSHQPSNVLEEPRYLHRIADEGCESSQRFDDDDDGKSCIDRNQIKDRGTAVRESNAIQHDSETCLVAETSKLGDGNCADQKLFLQSTNLEGTFCKALPNNPVENTGCLCRNACECEGCSNDNAELCSCSEDDTKHGSHYSELKDDEECFQESSAVQPCIGTSEAEVKCSLEIDGLPSSSHFVKNASENCVNMEPLQETPSEDVRVDTTSHTSEPDKLLKNGVSTLGSACEGFGSLKCSEDDTKHGSQHTELKDGEETFQESSAVQPCFGTSEAEVKCSLEINGLPCSSHFGNAHSICTEHSKVNASSSTLGTNNVAVARGSLSGIEIVDHKGPECVKCTNDDLPSGSDTTLYKGNGEDVHQRDASEPCFSLETVSNEIVSERVTVEHSETSSRRVSDPLISQRSGPETRKNPSGKQDDPLVFSASPINRPHGEEAASPCLTLVDSLVMHGNTPLPVLFHANPFERETDSLMLHLPEESMANNCQAEIGESSHSKDSQSRGKFVDCIGNSGGSDVNNSMFSASQAKSNSHEAKQEELGCQMGQFDLGGSALLRNGILQNGDLEMDVEHGISSSMQSHTDIVQETRESGKLDSVEERSLDCSSKYSRGGKNRLEKVSMSLESRELSNHQKLGNIKEMKAEKPQETVANGNRLKRKATDEPQERVVRTGLREKHNNDGSLSKDKIERRSDNDTLLSFREHLVLQRQAAALKRKAMESKKGLDQPGKSDRKFADSSKQSLKEMNNLSSQRKGLDQGEENQKVAISNNFLEIEPLSSMQAPVIRNQSLKLLTRDIAKRALLEAGFRIDLRPRKSRDYQDSVYMSPDGHAHWSLPKAWEALKKLQAEKSLHDDGQGSSHDLSHIADSHEKAGTSSLDRDEKTENLAKVDQNALKEVFSRFGNDERLNSALIKHGTCSVTNEMAQNLTEQADLTNADLTDFLVGDLGVLRRVTKKLLKQQKGNLNNSTNFGTPRLREADSCDEKRGLKRKLDSASALELLELKGLDGGGSAKKSQGICLVKSRDDKQQGTTMSLKQTALGTETTVLKHKAKKREEEDKTRVLKPNLKKGEKPKFRSGFRLEVRRASSGGSDEPACHSTRTVFAWMLDRGAVLERERIFFVDEVDHQIVKEGVVTREGILCSCCKMVFTVQSFEAHAGSYFGDWHEALVFTSGKRLIDCQQKAWDAEIHLRKAHNYVGISEDDTNDDSCLLCGDGGDLICCDGCPSTFHAACLKIDNVPDGDWYCPKCSCGICGGRQRDEEKGDPSVIVCNQCEHRYHIACLHGRPSFAGEAVFCRSSCEQIFSRLRELVGISHSLPGGFSWTLLRCMEEDKSIDVSESTMQIDCHSKLAVALLVIKECFNPMVDPRTNIDMITHAMYNRWSDFDRLNYAGFYTAVLEKEGEIISVASIRVHGVRLAEMPLIGTREKYRRQGMCRLLVGIIENLLGSLNVAYFILPAIAELFDTWTQAFGFRPLDAALKASLKDISMMVFPGTELLQKPLSVNSTTDVTLFQDPHGDS